jgi:hypothetical protein
MGTTAELAELRRTIGQLRQCVGALRSRYGDASAIRRLANDVERLDIDLCELETPIPPQKRAPELIDRSQIVKIPEGPYDPSLWQGADDEGIGGYHRDLP